MYSSCSSLNTCCRTEETNEIKRRDEKKRREEERKEEGKIEVDITEKMKGEQKKRRGYNRIENKRSKTKK